MEYLREVKSPVMVSVPRLYENIYSAVYDRIEKTSPAMKKLFKRNEDARSLSYCLNTQCLQRSCPMMNQKAVDRDWAERGFSCGLWVDPPGRCWEDFTHAVDELVMVLEGEVEFEIDGVVQRPEIGQELFIPAGALHSVRNRGNSTARWLYGYRRL